MSVDFIGPAIIGALVLAALLFIVFRARRQSKARAADLQLSWADVVLTQELQNFLISKIEQDLRQANAESRPLLTAIRKIVDKANPNDEALRDIAEIYQYRKGFKQEWVGE